MATEKATTTATVYNRPITVQKPIDVDDGQGGSTRTWSDYYSCFASIESFARGRGLNRIFFAGQLYPSQLRTIAMRWQTSFPIDATMRVKSVVAGRTHYYQIKNADDFHVENVEIVLMGEEIHGIGAS